MRCITAAMGQASTFGCAALPDTKRRQSGVTKDHENAQISFV
jgi:hypothetical protein